METKHSRRVEHMYQKLFVQSNLEQANQQDTEQGFPHKPSQTRASLRIEKSKTYRATKKIHVVLDDYFLDPIIGLIPVVGDSITSVFSLPYLYLSVFKLRSISLTLAIVFNVLLDFALGLFPFFIGTFLDVFHRAHKKNYRLLQGFVQNDAQVIKQVNRKAVLFALGILGMVVTIYWMIKLTASFISWLWSFMPF